MKKSFTLIELLVVVGLISLISGTVIGVYLTGIKSQRKILETQELLNQINYALEYMGRAIRMAKKDDIEIGGETANCCSETKVNYCTSTQEILFRNSRNQCQKFYLSGNAIFEEIGGTTSPLTSTTSIKINFLRFKVEGARQGDGKQPRVTISIEAETRGGRKMKFQTTVSQRDLDVTE